MSNKGLKYYSKILLQGSVTMSVAQAATKVVSLIVVPIFTYYLSPEEYGIISMVMIIVTVLGLFYNPGMMSATMRLYHDTELQEERQELIGSAFRFFVFFPLIFMVISIFIGPYLFPVLFSNLSFYPYGFLAVLLAFFSQPKRIWITLMTLHYKIKITAIFTVISVLLGAATSIILVVIFKMGAMGKVLGSFPAVLLYFSVSFFTIRKFSNGLWSLKSIKKQLSFGFPLIIALWSYEILHVADRYILERMTDLSSVGLYTFGYQIAEMPMILALGVRQLWNPIFYENMNNKNYDTVSKLVLFYVVILSLIMTLVILFNKEVILLIMNNRYFGAIPVIGIIVIGIYFNSLLTITNSLLAYKNRFGIISKIALIASILNVGLNMVLIPCWGIIGSAMATAISYFVYLVIGLLLELEMIKLFSFIKVIIVPTIFVVISFPLTMSLNSDEILLSEVILKVIYLLLFISTIFLSKLIRISEMKLMLKSVFQKRENP